MTARKTRGEVFTPLNLINEMLDKLPDEVWYDANLKWLEPSAGNGRFVKAVYDRLMLTIKDERHILENMLYMVELDADNCETIRNTYDAQYKLNLFEGSFIEGDYNDVDIYSLNIKLDNNKRFFDKIKKFNSNFDIIVGNPPYNNNKEVPIYNKFIIKSLDFKPSYLLFIVPSRWFSGGKGLDSFRRMMLDRTDIKLIKHFENNEKVFGRDVNITGGVNYFLIDKKYSGLCDYNGNKIKLNRYDILISDPHLYPFIDKIKKYTSLSSIYERNYYNIATDDKRLVKDKKDENYIVCYVNQKSGLKKYINKNQLDKDISNWKVITTEANRDMPSFGNKIIKRPNEVHSQTYISFDVNNEKEAKSLLSYLECKITNYILSLRKNTQHISYSTILWIPLPPLDRIWNDEEIYNYFKLTRKEINLIEENTIKDGRVLSGLK